MSAPVDGSEPDSSAERASFVTGPVELAAGDSIGRFLVLEQLGAGAMGVVFAAHDPQLGRRVAIKLVRAGRDNPASAQARLQREAMALAQLNHHNIVTVYDVGIHAGSVFVAMEYVEGETLEAWMCAGIKGRRRPWREVVEVFAAAAEGLAAAHASGFVHRDFKPDNVMIGSDGRIRVMDFGLARVDAAPDEVCGASASSSLVALESALDSNPSSRLTRTGGFLGTPAYMAPEQLRGEPASARSDQFAFCVALHEALYGARPFRGAQVEQLRRAMLGSPTRPPTENVAPPSLYKLVRRGLSLEAGERFATMDALLVELRGAERRLRRHRAAAFFAGVGLATAAVLGVRNYDLTQREALCEREAASIDSLWGPDARAAVSEGLTRSQRAEDEGAAEQALTWLDARTRDWREATYESCRAATLVERWTPARHAKARWCLAKRRSELSATISGLQSPHTASVSRAISVASDLVPATDCIDELSLDLAPAPPPADEYDAAEQMLASVARVRYLHALGNVEAGLELAEQLREPVAGLGWAPLEAELMAERYGLLDDSGEFDAAAEQGERAYFHAARSGDWATAERVASDLIHTVGHVLGDIAQGERWSELAELAIAYSGDPLGLREARRQSGIAVLRFSQEDYAAARVAFETSMRASEAVYGEFHPAVASTMGNLAMAYGGEGDYETSKRLHLRQLEIMNHVFGPTHPATIRTRQDLATDYVQLHEYARAEPLLEQALAGLEASLGPAHMDLSTSYIYLGEIARTRGDYARMLDMHRRALALSEGSLGPDHRWVALDHINVAAALLGLERFEQAEQSASRALEILRASGLPRAHLAEPLAKLGLAQLGLGRHADAMASFEQALALEQAEDMDLDVRAELEFGLGRALWEAPPELERERSGVLALVSNARRRYVEVDEQVGLVTLDRWLEAQPELARQLASG